MHAQGGSANVAINTKKPSMIRVPREPLLALALAIAGAAHAQDSPVTTRVGVLSALIVRGLQYSDPGAPVVLAGADVYGNAGWSIGGAAMALRSAAGHQGSGWVLQARRDWSVGEKWTLAAGARHDGYVGDSRLRSWCYNEVDAAATYGDTWRAGLGWRPNGGPGCASSRGTRPRLALDFNVRWPVADGVGVDAGAGRFFSGGAASYDFGQWGFFAGESSWTLHLGRTLTHGAAPARYGHSAQSHWVASALWRF